MTLRMGRTGQMPVLLLGPAYSQSDTLAPPVLAATNLLVIVLLCEEILKVFSKRRQ